MEIHIRLSYPVQCMIKCFSPRFAIDCQRLRAAGMRPRTISLALGLSKKVVKRALRDDPGGCHSLEDDVWSK